jgi:hypothetical protein
VALDEVSKRGADPGRALTAGYTEHDIVIACRHGAIPTRGCSLPLGRVRSKHKTGDPARKAGASLPPAGSPGIMGGMPRPGALGGVTARGDFP